MSLFFLGSVHIVLFPGTVKRKTFEGENFREFRGFGAIRESFLHEILGVASFATAKASNPRKFSPRSYFHQLRESCISRNFPAIRYREGLQMTFGNIP